MVCPVSQLKISRDRLERWTREQGCAGASIHGRRSRNGGVTPSHVRSTGFMIISLPVSCNLNSYISVLPKSKNFEYDN